MTKDSVTSVTPRPVEINIKPDTATSTVNLDKFTHTFSKAAVGAVIASKRKGTASYQIKKVSDVDFEVEAVAEGKDTTVVVQDTHTTVREKITTTVEKQPSVVARVWNEVKNLVLVGLIVLVGVVILLLSLR